MILDPVKLRVSILLFRRITTDNHNTSLSLSFFIFHGHLFYTCFKWDTELTKSKSEFSRVCYLCPSQIWQPQALCGDLHFLKSWISCLDLSSLSQWPYWLGHGWWVSFGCLSSVWAMGNSCHRDLESRNLRSRGCQGWVGFFWSLYLDSQMAAFLMCI